MNQDNNIINTKSIITLSIVACICSATWAFAFVAVILIIIQRKRLFKAENFFNNKIAELEYKIRELDTTKKQEEIKNLRFV